MKCPHDSSRWELSGGELTGFGRDLGDGGLGGIMGWLAPVGGDLLSGWREKREPPLQLSDLPAAAVGQLISFVSFCFDQSAFYHSYSMHPDQKMIVISVKPIVMNVNLSLKQILLS